MTSSPEFQPIVIERKPNSNLLVKVEGAEVHIKGPTARASIGFYPIEALATAAALQEAAIHLDPSLDDYRTPIAAKMASHKLKTRITELEGQVTALTTRLDDLQSPKYEDAASEEQEREAVLPEGWLLQQASTKDWMIRIPGDDTPFYYDRSHRMWQNGSIHVRRVACWLDMFPWTSDRAEMIRRINAFIAAGGMDPNARIASVTFTTGAGAEAAR